MVVHALGLSKSILVVELNIRAKLIVVKTNPVLDPASSICSLPGLLFSTDPWCYHGLNCETVSQRFLLEIYTQYL